MTEQTTDHEMIPESKAARWAWRVSLIPLLGVPLFIALAFVALYRIGSKGLTGFWLLRRGVIAVFLISVVTYFGVYLAGYSMSYPWVYDKYYFFLPRHGVMTEHFTTCRWRTQEYHFFFGGNKIRSKSFYHDGQKSTEGSYLISQTPLYTQTDRSETPIYARHRIGKWTEWYYNGRKCAEGEYSQDKEIGMWQYWSPDGKEQSAITYSNSGKITGKVWGVRTEGHGLDEINTEKNFVDGKLHGIYQAWDLDGRKVIEGNYVNGQRDGFWKFYFTRDKNGKRVSMLELRQESVLSEEDLYGIDGNLSKEIYYRNGKYVKSTLYQDGKPIKESK